MLIGQKKDQLRFILYGEVLVKRTKVLFTFPSEKAFFWIFEQNKFQDMTQKSASQQSHNISS